MLVSLFRKYSVMTMSIRQLSLWSSGKTQSQQLTGRAINTRYPLDILYNHCDPVAPHNAHPTTNVLRDIKLWTLDIITILMVILADLHTTPPLNT
jgi:hypothetical protein